MISINRIIEPKLFAIKIIEFLFEKFQEIEITIYGRLDHEDKKFLNRFNKTSLIRKFIFKTYNFKFDINGFKDIQSRLEKYFRQDWGVFINENNKGLFSFKQNNFFIDCADEQDKHIKMQFFDLLIKNEIIDKYEIIEDDYIDPYFEDKKTTTYNK